LSLFNGKTREAGFYREDVSIHAKRELSDVQFES